VSALPIWPITDAGHSTLFDKEMQVGKAARRAEFSRLTAYATHCACKRLGKIVFWLYNARFNPQY
jgi:hypothetical protein